MLCFRKLENSWWWDAKKLLAFTFLLGKASPEACLEEVGVRESQDLVLAQPTSSPPTHTHTIYLSTPRQGTMFIVSPYIFLVGLMGGWRRNLGEIKAKKIPQVWLPTSPTWQATSTAPQLTGTDLPLPRPTCIGG